MDKDKNKNRTDLLAAGRKKLQQFRQKKDGKSSKSSGKAAKSEHDIDADAASAAKPAAALLQVPDAVVSSVHDSNEGFVDIPVAYSHGHSQSNDVDIADIDPLSVGLMLEASSVPTTLESSVELMREDLGVNEAMMNLGAVKEQDLESSVTYQADSTQTLSVESAMLTSGNSGGLVSEMNSVYLASPITVDSFTPPDLVGVTKLVGIAVEAEHVHGADQGADCLVSKQVDTSSGIDLEGDAMLDLPGLGESAEFCVGSSCGDTSMKEPTIEMEPTKLNSISAAAGETNEVKEVWTMDGHSVSPQLLRVSHDCSAVTPELAVHQGKDAVASFLNEGKSEMRSAEGYEANSQEEVVNVEDFLVAEARPMEDKMVSLSSGTGIISMSVSHLAKLLRMLDEEEFKLVLASRELTADSEFRSTDSSTTNGELRSNSRTIVPEYQSSDVLEEVTEQLYLANVEKDVFLLQLNEQLVQHLEFSHQHKQLLDEMSIASSLITELRGRNESLAEELVKCKSEFQAAVCATEELEKQFHTAKAEIGGISTRADELHLELERSHGELSSLSADLADCRALVSALRVENDNLNGNLTSAVEEKKRLTEEKGYLALGNEELLKELAECKGSLLSLQEENVNLSGSLALKSEERRKLKEEKENVVHENEKLLTNLTEHKALLEALQVENATLNGSLTSVMEERFRLGEEKDHFVTENEELLSELADCRSLVAGIQTDYRKAGDGMKDATLHLEQLEQENMLSSKSGDAANQIEVTDMPSRGPECATTADETHQLLREWKTENFSPRLRKPDDGSMDWSHVEQLKLEACDHSSGFVDLKVHLEEAENITQELENAIEGMHSHSVSLSKSSGKMVVPAVSRLIQAFESKAHLDDHDIEEVPSAADQSLVNSFTLIKEQTRKLRAVFKKLHADAKKASKLYMGEIDCRIAADAALGEPKVTYEALEEHIIFSEAAIIELVVLYEFLKQHLYDIEAKRVEHLALCQALREQSTVSVAKNIDLVKKLGDYQLRARELERQLDEMHSSSDEMASSMSNQVELMHIEVAERASMLEQEWNSTVARIVQTVGKLDLLVGSSYSTTPLTSYYPDGLSDTGTLVASSVEAATTVIEDLRKKLEASRKDHEAMSSSLKSLYEKHNDLHGKHELASGVLLRVYSNLKKLVDDSCGHIEESRIIQQNENVLDPLSLNNYDTLMEQVAVFLGERLQLESMNDQLNLEMINKAKEIEEMKERGLDSDGILKLVEDVEGAIMLEGTGLKSDNLGSRLQYLISFLFHKYKEADKTVRWTTRTNSREEMELSELQGQIDHLMFLIVQHETENLILKESLRQGVEDLIAIRSDLQEKVNELEQSEQRVASIREKLGIAVSKGKGLIVQRDTLKKSLAETSNELDKCSQELQLKDTRLQEVETKLKTYLEAGERVEALESELSYIRNSATALRESFLLKDSVLQRIEEILDDLQLPEHFHSRDTIEKVDWLAQSITRNTFALTDWDQKSSVGGGSYSDTGFAAMDAWKEDSQLNLNSGDDLQRKYEELQSKFYGLAEQNEMLEQSLMERNNVMQRWEEMLEGITMPLHLRSMEPADRIEWLGSALSVSDHHCNALQVKIDNFETYCATLTADLEGSQKRLSELETALQAVTHEKEHLSDSLEILTRDYDKVSEKLVQFEVENDKLHKELTALKDTLVENNRNQKHIEHVDGEIRRLVNLVTDVIRDSVTDDVVSGGSSTECLERVLQKLVEKYTNLSLENCIVVESDHETKTEKDHAIQCEQRDSEGLKAQDLSILKKDLDEALHGLICVKVERDRYMEQNQSLTHEVEALNLKSQEMQDLLSQEEQKSASVREKLNVAVRKGKSLVQQRDSLKQTIEEVNNEVERMKSEINHRDSSLSEYEQKIKVLSTYQESVEVLESDNLSLRNRLAETEYLLHEKTHTLSLMLNTLKGIGAIFEFNTSNPVEMLEQIGRQWHDRHAAVAASEQDMMKSKRAAELLLAELNEVQERNDGFQEELAKYSSELLELSKERDLVEAAKCEAFSQVKKLSAIRSEEVNNQFAELMILKSYVDQVRKGLFETNDLLGRVLSKDVEYVQNLEASLMSCLEPSEALNVVGLPLGCPDNVISLNKENQEMFLVKDFMLDSKIQEHSNDNNLVEIFSLTGHQLQGLAKEIDALKEKLYKHSVTLDERVKHVVEVVGIVRRELTSHKKSYDSMKENIIRLECTEKEKDAEIGVLHANINLLYEACRSSVIGIENWKADFVSNGLAATDHGMNSETSVSVDGGNFSQRTLLSSEQHFSTMADRLLSVVKDFIGTQANIVEAGYKEMKTTISNLQKELQEKDIKKDRICMELVSQIKEAEAAAGSHLQDFQSANVRLHDLERRLQAMTEQRNILEQRVKELQDGEANSKDLEERVKSLNEVLAAKEQEIESLMQALDEEEIQMEELTNKIGELERVVQQKNVDLENLEASRGKAMKKLSITVSKFDELHHLSGSLLSEVEKLQLQLQNRDAEISFLRQEVTRCTSDALVASQMNSKRNSDEIYDLLTWLDSMTSGVLVHDAHFDEEKLDEVHQYKERFQKHIMSLVAEIEDLRAVTRSRDMLLQVERNRVGDLTRKGESLEDSLREKESQLTRLLHAGDSVQTASTASEILEVEPVINKWAAPGASITPQVRSLRKVNNDQVAIAIDMDTGSGGKLEDEDDDKAHGFKSLTTSRIVPRFTRPVTDMIDGLWVSCDRTLMRQPVLRLGVIIYWAFLHALLTTFVV
ncbi:trans-Golgi network-localized SYP41-interacting protein 1 isoform X3 [Rhododendron vialii]|uniref:trans-Golgi network-localized SYP41-interacting protein 1 isoform X3 n=1 Tax=Rhododendron vialii TaxID=182163 RepID=UPI00265FF9BA|nr:trans-Golgi network-localized SYP41-interacting protein 1 isoform X3 [Rhododendron vialii]